VIGFVKAVAFGTAFAVWIFIAASVIAAIVRTGS